MASPKKAAILGLLFVVAICYWSPLVWGWLKPDSKAVSKKKASTTSSSREAKPVALDTANGSSIGNVKHGWKEVAQWIDSDPRMIAASGFPGRAQPFDFAEQAESTPGNQTKGSVKPDLVSTAPHPHPKKLGLVPSSIIVGPRSRAALINGKSYLLGEAIRVNHEGHVFEFHLTDIRDNGIVLQRKEKKYDVPLAEPKPSDRLEINALKND